MQEQPLVSIVIPVYNVRKYIGETLGSVLSQTYSNIEIVVVDDGSTDGSSEVIEEFCRTTHRIQYIHQPNSGVSEARNAGIRASKGQYIAFLDGDDLWLPSKLEKQIARIKETGMDACYCGYTEYFGDDTGKSFPSKYPEGLILYDILLEKTSAWTSTWVIRKDLLPAHDLAFTKGCSWAEDMEFFARLMFFARVCAVSESLALYRKRENSLSSAARRTTEIPIWERYIQWVEKQDNPLGYDVDRLVYAIRHYRIPGIAIFCLFEADPSSVNKDMEGLWKYIPAFKPNTSPTAVKLWMKQLALKNRFFIKWMKDARSRMMKGKN